MSVCRKFYSRERERVATSTGRLRGIDGFDREGDFTPHEDVNIIQNIVINFSFSSHKSINSPIPGTSTCETAVSPEVVQILLFLGPQLVKQLFLQRLCKFSYFSDLN
ncbi:hypothetical protein AVEN_157084-1 [Araneus ventricosus]|uniref:Uncharacterized protein n=1 Tax=Araneus ventricosus TaxID=182803 RepID=A0A4Y2J240_ARAVE|nr:hypothetical protein AVEN_157084-1 [Araneus ventricosus]